MGTGIALPMAFPEQAAPGYLADGRRACSRHRPAGV